MSSFGYVQDICKANHPWIFYMIKMLHPSLKLELDGLRKSVSEVREIDLVVLNEGLSDLETDTIKVQANMTLFSKVAVQIGQKLTPLSCSSYSCKFNLKGIKAES